MNAIISGASKGIGKALAKKLVQQGMNVAICARNENELKSTANELIEINPNIEVLSFASDLSIKEGADAFGNYVLSKWNRIDLLINNTGTYIAGDICSEEDGILEKLIATNLYSAYHLTRSIVNHMMKNELQNGTRGHIMNISSIAALKAYPHGGSYGISKYALEGFSKNLREELKPHFIKVSTINPGATMSDSWKGSGVDESRIIPADDIAEIVWTLFNLSAQTVVEEIVLRPQLGDL